MSTAAFLAASTVLSIAGTGLTVAGQLHAGRASAQMSTYQSQVAAMNQRIAEDNAERAIQRSQIEQEDTDVQNLALMGEQEAAQGASGLSLGGRSFMLTRRAARELARRDALNVRQAGDIEAHNFRVQGENFRTEGVMRRAEGRNALTASYLAGGASLLSGASRVLRPHRYGEGGLVS